MNIEIRPLSTPEDCKHLQHVERLIWGAPDEDLIPVHVAITVLKNGGGALGAFSADGPAETGGRVGMTLWFMGNPKPISVSGIARAPLAKHEGAFSQWGMVPVPQDMDVEDFAAAFVRFENGATLMLEVSWLLHHDTAGEDMQMWLYGTEAGCHWPKCEILGTNYATKQFYNTTLKLTADTMEPHALECVEFARCVAEGAPSPVPAEQSMQVMAILDGIYRSQREGREVTI